MIRRADIGSCSFRSTDTFYIENLGCAKNQVDAEVIITSLEDAGFAHSDSPDEAEFIIVNTCGFIRSAKEESIEAALSLRQRFPGKRLILTGCLAERYGSSLSPILPEVDGIIGNAAPGRFAEALSQLIEGSQAVIMPESESSMPIRRKLLTFPGSAYLKIGEGCSNRCSFCAIPLIRGPVKSRGIPEVLEEFSVLLKSGVREINLIAQDLGSFGTDRGGQELCLLLERISGLEGDFWVRLLYIHPDRFPLDILPILRKDGRILPYFDLPFQHASEKILRRMNRSGDRGTYLALLGRIRDTFPDAVIRSTFLVGFPGETEEDFEELLAFQQEASLDWAGAFTFSREEGTPAYRYRSRPGERMSAAVTRKRKSLLEERQSAITESRLARFTGRELDVLVEEQVEGQGLYLARAFLNAPEVDGLVVVHAEHLVPGTMVRVAVAKLNGVDLEAVLLSENPHA